MYQAEWEIHRGWMILNTFEKTDDDILVIFYRIKIDV